MQAKRQLRLMKPWYPETPAEKLYVWCGPAAGYFLDDRVIHPATPTTAEDWVCRVLIADDDCHSAEEKAVIGLENPTQTSTTAGLRLSESELRHREFHGAALTCLSVSNRLDQLIEQSRAIPTLDLSQVQQVISPLRESAVLRSSELEAAGGKEGLFARPWLKAKLESVDQECAAKEQQGQALLYALSLRLPARPQ